LEYATAAKLFNFPDQRGGAGALLKPEVAESYRVSRDGRTYTFFIGRGFRFSDGAPVKAKNFAHAFDRVLNPELQSPGRSFIKDPAGVDVTAYHVHHNRFVVHLLKPSGRFLYYLTMPFFQATSLTLPVGRPVTKGPIPSAGPYF